MASRIAELLRRVRSAAHARQVPHDVDDLEAGGVIIVNETLARRFWPLAIRSTSGGFSGGALNLHSRNRRDASSGSSETFAAVSAWRRNPARRCTCRSHNSPMKQHGYVEFGPKATHVGRTPVVLGGGHRRGHARTPFRTQSARGLPQTILDDLSLPPPQDVLRPLRATTRPAAALLTSWNSRLPAR